ncbi:MAG TPA: hypothetical protein VMS84_07560 [Mycobacterium sp.]|jgi:hypothetical protein|nr:hypothetical protein [Mycobacterium sp.]
MLVRVVGECWHAFHYDVMRLGRDVNSLTLAEMITVVVGAPPTSSVRYFLDGGWSREAQLLANMQEQQAGIGTLSQPYPRPGVAAREVDPMEGAKFFPMQAMSWEEADKRDAARYASKPKGRSRSRVYSATGLVS